MINWFLNINPPFQALIAGIFTWLITALGAGLVFFFKKTNNNLMDGLVASAAGIMISASFFSLIAPAIEISDNLFLTTWVILFLGFLSGSLLIYFGNKIFYNLKKNIDSKRTRMFLLTFSITLHNIPEGLAIGVAFGGLIGGVNNAGIMAALLLAIGIGIQNFPEGSAISMPLYRDGMSKFKAFLIGQLSAIIEPISAFIGAVLVSKIIIILPYMLSFAAGAMIYVAVVELIPESMKNEKKDLMALFVILGFAIMMILDVALS